MFASASSTHVYTHASSGASSPQIATPVCAPSTMFVCAPMYFGFSTQAHLAIPEASPSCATVSATSCGSPTLGFSISQYDTYSLAN
ncbi:hypothetical protein V6N13_126488 [Hibiscus sabdariffa]